MHDGVRVKSLSGLLGGNMRVEAVRACRSAMAFWARAPVVALACVLGDPGWMCSLGCHPALAR